MNPEAPYNVHFPFRRGELNIHKNIGGSLMSIIEDLRTIWLHIIELHLGIEAKNLKVIFILNIFVHCLSL